MTKKACMDSLVARTWKLASEQIIISVAEIITVLKKSLFCSRDIGSEEAEW